eukprot:TRINITY_DN74758_c0_g1_i1.p3 TRINITY_DN74758_c0_g1~~TRINITY_DN74758_c0_g1_i1.p3  ORF type:complete len:133 (-),score=24.85 TRINITY_DN74758_c0_g1_i1:93-491(-)
MNRMLAPARQQPQPDLNHINDREHEKDAAHEGPHSGPHHPILEQLRVYVGPEGILLVLAVEQVERQLQTQRYQAREQEEAERRHLQHQQPFLHVDPRVAFVPVLKAALPGCRQRETHEHSDREEGIDVHDPI